MNSELLAVWLTWIAIMAAFVGGVVVGIVIESKSWIEWCKRLDGPIDEPYNESDTLP